jgi:flavin reductase (DIM6/NTAB) family NADH-FMN oxidoreductase RutF
MTVNPALYRQLMSQFASGVVIVTLRQGDFCHGITVSSFCFLSMEPPQVLVCINQNSYFLSLLEQSEYFGINILDENGEELSRHFATRSLTKFHTVPYFSGQSGVPLLAEAVATMECRLANRFPGGDHLILTGDVLHADMDQFAQPLIYFRREYSQLRRGTLIEDSLVASSLVASMPGN